MIIVQNKRLSYPYNIWKIEITSSKFRLKTLIDYEMTAKIVKEIFDISLLITGNGHHSLPSCIITFYLHVHVHY